MDNKIDEHIRIPEGMFTLVQINKSKVLNYLITERGKW
jgi:hypothetical protein